MTGRSQGYLAATACVLGFGACTAPTEHTDLRPDGPPEVLAVLASDDPAGASGTETATFCKPGDNKRPGLVPAALFVQKIDQICPDDVTQKADEAADTQPVGWYVRIMFDELLNPDKAEDLLPIIDSSGKPTGQLKGSLANTQPVTLTCNGVPVNYDKNSYYDPSGNAFSWPLGPSLFIAANDTSTIPTGTECEVTIKDSDSVEDKDGNHVPAAELGPYKFKISPMKLAAEDPAPPKDPKKPDEIDPGHPEVISFNAQVNVASLDPTEVTILEVTTCADTVGIPRVAAIAPHVIDQTKMTVDLQSIEISDANAPTGSAWEPSKTYTITFNAGAQVTQDIAGGGVVSLPAAADLTLCFQTSP